MQKGDIITRLNNEAVTELSGFQDLYKKVRKDKPHGVLVLVVQRNNGEDTIRIEPPQ